MSNQSTTQNIADKAGEMTGQAQLKKDELMNSQSSDQNASYTAQASNLFQQTGEQVKNIAQGAADAVKNTLGMNNASNASNASNAPNTTNQSSNPHSRS